MDPIVGVVFALVYAGMMLGRFPGLGLDRTGIALLGAIALLATGRSDVATAWGAIDVTTIGLLFGLMVVSAQFRLGGFYTAVTRRIASADGSPERLMWALVWGSGALSALLANDIVCLAVPPILVDACVRRRLDPVPFLLALAAAANVGSAATLIGNPQNMLVGQTLDVSFARYLAIAALPAAVGLVLVWWIVCRAYRGRWARELAAATAGVQPFDRWQTAKGLVVLAALVGAFLVADVPREILALGAAGVLLLSRRMRSPQILALIDWPLLVLFVGLFVVHEAMQRSGAPAQALAFAREHGCDLTEPAWLFGATVVASNVVSNVPAVMLLLPAATDPFAAPVLALSSTLAGNLFLVGSIANLIVVEQAARLGVAPATRSWFREHLRVGVPITLATLAVSALWLLLLAALGV